MDPASVSYTITGQELTEELQPDGRFVDTWRITYTTPSGVVGFVRVPNAQYDVDRIDALIRANVAQVEQVHALGAPPASGLAADFGA